MLQRSWAGETRGGKGFPRLQETGMARDEGIPKLVRGQGRSPLLLERSHRKNVLNGCSQEPLFLWNSGCSTAGEQGKGKYILPWELGLLRVPGTLQVLPLAPNHGSIPLGEPSSSSSSFPISLDTFPEKKVKSISLHHLEQLILPHPISLFPRPNLPGSSLIAAFSIIVCHKCREGTGLRGKVTRE